MAQPPQPSHEWRPDRAYNQLSGLPPVADLETPAVLRQCIPARAALGELKQAANLIPNPTVLINIIPLLEAQASSEIENIVTTTDELFRHQKADDAAAPATKEALRYRQALLEGFQAMTEQPLTTKTAERVCSQIKGVQMRVRQTPGTTLATETGRVIYTPPDGEDLLRSLLANWERFMHQEKGIDPLIRMAACHYQFEAIHPFTDGNGRTGRVLNSLFLIHEGLLTLPILYLSRYIIGHREDYYRLLLEVTSSEKWEAWLLYLIKGVEETANWTRSKIEAIVALHRHTKLHIRSRLPKIYSHELIDLIFTLPYCRIQNAVDAKIAERQTASRYLKELVKIGVLKELQAGREKLFVHPKYMRLLTEDIDEFVPY